MYTNTSMKNIAKISTIPLIHEIETTLYTIRVFRVNRHTVITFPAVAIRNFNDRPR